MSKHHKYSYCSSEAFVFLERLWLQPHTQGIFFFSPADPVGAPPQGQNGSWPPAPCSQGVHPKFHLPHTATIPQQAGFNEPLWSTWQQGESIHSLSSLTLLKPGSIPKEKSSISPFPDPSEARIHPQTSPKEHS